jgi:hypothetical protein
MCGGIDIGDDFLLSEDKAGHSLIRIAENVESAEACQRPAFVQCSKCKQKIARVKKETQSR